MSQLAANPLLDERAAAWSSRSDISARSALVTILGDTIAPLGGQVWLRDLITMAAPFGFNERLVRTSMYRLVAEHWVESQRIGRRSRYALTDFGCNEFENAEQRIYRREEPAWDGEWTMVFPQSVADQSREFFQMLRWRGFAAIGRDVFAAPGVPGAVIVGLCDQLDLAPPLIASARFENIEPLTTMTAFQDSSGLAAANDAYQAFIDDYQSVVQFNPTAHEDVDAFVLRTMVVHDLRRVRLRDPELPRDLLPVPWHGDAAMRLAADTYHAVDAGAWRYVESVTELTPDPGDPLLARRFPSREVDRKRNESS